MAVKEVWVYLLAYNLIRLMMVEAALIAHRLPREISFKHTVQMWIAWNAHGNNIDVRDKLHGLFVLIAQQQVGKRPGRIEPRAVKRRPKPYPLLTKPRAQSPDRTQEARHQTRLDVSRGLRRITSIGDGEGTARWRQDVGDDLAVSEGNRQRRLEVIV